MESKNIYIVRDKDYLMHHGIKGQKWGVENGPPYPLNPSKDYSKAEQKANKKLVKNLKKSYEKSYSDFRKTVDDSNQFKRALNSNNVVDARNKLLEEQEKITRFYDNEKLSNKYLTLAAIVGGIDYDLDMNKIDKVKDMIKGYKYEDFNQGYGTAYQLYLIDNGKSTQDGFKAQDKYTNELIKSLDDVLGEYGTMTYNSFKDKGKLIWKETVSEVMARNNNDYYWTEDPLSNDQEKTLKKSLDEAKKYYNQHKNELNV